MSDSTPDKLAMFRQVIRLQLRLCSTIPCRQYCYIDMNAGEGIDAECGSDGSPLIFLSEVARYGFPWQAVLVESDPAKHSILKSRVCDVDHVSTCHGDHDVVVPSFCSVLQHEPYGVIYHDPYNVPAFNTLALLSRMEQCRRMEIVISVGANGVKRANGIKRKYGLTYQTLIDGLSLIDKSRWLVAEPVGKWQWTMLIGSNWKRYPEWKAQGFHSVDSERGRYILEKVTYSKDEQHRLYQYALPFLSGIPETPDVPSDPSGSDSGGERRLPTMPPAPGH